MGEFIILAVFIILTIVIIPHLLEKYFTVDLIFLIVYILFILQIYIFYMQKI